MVLSPRLAFQPFFWQEMPEMFLAVVMAVMTMAVSDNAVDRHAVDEIQSSQNLTISQDEMELLEQMELLEVWDILKSPVMDQEMDRVVPARPEERKK